MSEMREYIENHLKQRKLSLSKLALRLGYRSKTSIERIMDAKSNAQSVYQFVLAMEREMDLTPEEQERLRVIAQTMILGPQAYHAEIAMWRFLRAERAEAAVPLLRDIDTGETQSIRQRYTGKKNLRVSLFNCSRVALFTELNALLRSGASVTHYICVDAGAERTINMVNALMAVLFEENYSCLALDETERESPFSIGITRADMMLCQYTDEHGEACEDAVIFTDPSVGQLMRRGHSTDDIYRWMNVRTDGYQSIKRVFHECVDFRGYLKYSADYAALEENKTIWKVKPDVGIDYIPVDILEAAMREGAMKDEAELALFLEAVRPIYAGRYQNAMTKKKPVYTVFKKEAMRKFAATGMTSDHFWGMRPFTPDERIRVLGILLKQLKENPYFNLYFLKDDNLLRDAEIACFKDVGVLVLSHNTNYDFANGHAEVMITHTEFMRLYQQFFMKTLLTWNVLSRAETIALFEELIHACRRL